MFDDIRKNVEGWLQPILDELAVELVELRIYRKGRTLAIDVLADKSQGGITVDECIIINKKLVQKIDSDSFSFRDYALEVSSPGLDRPLKNKKDFLRVVGRNVHFFLVEPLDNKWEQEGVIQEVDDQNNIMIQANGNRVSLPLEKIRKAIQVV